MKTINYLFIAAVILLCSCKGSSYLKQRYTHFGHGHAKSVAHQPALAAVRQVPAETQSMPQATMEKTALMVELESQVQEKTLVASAGTKLQQTHAKNLRRLLTVPVNKANAEFQKKKDQVSAAQSHRGLISGLLGLILYIVLCAVVIAAIIILVLLIV